MKKLLLFILILTSVNAFGQRKPTYFKFIRAYLIDVNNDGKVDTILISSSLKNKELFNKISIAITGYRKQTFVAKDSWTLVDSDFIKTNKNEINSKLIYLKKTERQAVILLFGILDGAGYRGEFSIINIQNNYVKMVFDHTDENIDVELPVTLTNLDQTGRLQFVFRGLGEFYKQKDNLKADIGTYHPFFVFTVDSVCKLNKPLMKQYNQQHYVFAGYSYNEGIQILYPRNGGRPKIWKREPKS